MPSPPHPDWLSDATHYAAVWQRRTPALPSHCRPDSLLGIAELSSNPALTATKARWSNTHTIRSTFCFCGDMHLSPRNGTHHDQASPAEPDPSALACPSDRVGPCAVCQRKTHRYDPGGRGLCGYAA